ncbi:SUN domain-containing protein 1 [Selaginella moellendorffii]|nr:SUN domain-containing protein 1 [Selaginella moellendorffii]|eukprot:XP_002970573.2 SUN domain-containing protein 1 [Selaginella moellendorffii]
MRMASAVVCPPPASIFGAARLAGVAAEGAAGDRDQAGSKELVTMAPPGTSGRTTRRSSTRSTTSQKAAAETHRPVTRSRKQARPSKSPIRRSSLAEAPAEMIDVTAWDLVGHFFSWGFVALVVVLGLISTFWNWQESQSAGGGLVPSAREFAEMDSMLRKSTKWMQAQLDLIDMKIGKEMAGLKRDVEHMIDAEAFSIASKVHNLKSQMDSIESSLNFLKQEGILTRQETLQLIGSAADDRATDGSGKALSLDDVRAAAKKIIEDELERHRADGIGRTDYALASGGGRVIDYSEGYFSLTPWSGLLGILPGDYRRHPKANKILEPSFGEPGQCLPLKGSNVFVDIRLRTAIYADSITLEHVSKRVAYDTGSAPRDFQVFGWLEASAAHKKGERVLLGSFRYDIESSSVQTFRLYKTASKLLVNTVRVHVVSNYGSSTHTCLYRVRVHGTEPHSEE